MKYGTILADPPWPYEQKLKSAKTRGGVKYPTMTVEEIAAIPVPDWLAPDAQVWLWSTNSHLHSAFHVLEAWGVRYITTATWCKTQFGLGYWIRGASEHLLLGVKGNPRSLLRGPHGATGNAYSTVMTAPRGQHSEKPQVSYDMIEAMSPAPRLELFARRQRLGWDSWGLDVGVRIEPGKEMPHDRE